MNKAIKTGILTVVLVVPVFVYLFLKVFGKNELKLPVYYASDSTEVKGGYEITDAHTIPDFNFVRENGQSVSSKDLEGYIYVADFIFTRCQGICPKMTSQLTTVQEAFHNDNQVKIISFTVDPEFDSAEVLKKYAKEYNANPDQWIFATGKKDSIYALAQKGFFVTAMEDRERPLDFIHSEKLVLVDKEGRIRGYYKGTEKKEVDRLITEIKVLEEIYASKQSDKK